jgi:crotonobetainyl-CoA:carnitine CoA-transferase CaiB-like acyl-CoA transferase
MPGALDGVKILEVAEYLALPSAMSLLSDWGAEVIKVEKLEGDSLRPLESVDGVSIKDINVWWEQPNRGKRGIAEDLWQEEDRKIVYELVERSDVFVTNFTLPVIERFQFVCLQSDRYWPQFCRGLGLAHLIDDPKFSTHTLRAQNNVELIAVIEAALAAKTYAQVRESLEAAGEAVYQRVQNPLEVISDPQALANHLFTEIDHPSGRRIKLIAGPARFSRPRPKSRPRPQKSDSTPKRSCLKWAIPGTTSGN